MILDDHFVIQVSAKLELFKRQKKGLFNFRCPYCGDSKTKKNKARGYLYRSKTAYVYKCHNCGISKSFSNFLKDQDPHIHDDYVMEKFKDSNSVVGKHTFVPAPKFNFKTPKFDTKSIDLEKISELNTSHIARKYLEKRQIKDLSRFYYAEKFKKWTNKQKKTFDTLRQDGHRIIIPFFDENGKMFGYQGRSLDPNPRMRYITIMLDESRPKIFGLDKIDSTKPVHIVEGPFDATFLNNSIAMAGSDIDPRSYNWSDYIWVYDNEPRNREIVSKISRSVDRGDKVVIWPKNIQQKDINDMILAGHDVQNVVQSNVYQNLEAKLKLNDWKRV